NEIPAVSAFNRLVDAADPDSEASRQMTLWASQWSGHRQDIRAQLARWRDNSMAAKTIVEHYPNLREAIPLAEHVRDLSAAALEALDDLEQHRRPSRAWMTRQRLLLERTGVPQADLTVTLVDTVRTLIGKTSARR
ncbi:MAG TPA: hypothetical protein VMB21_22020, partial [Candidatus Limnocylindria bacterium]|nr:hypothetical protein [Candidatus Limnocylindria bacterium]